MPLWAKSLGAPFIAAAHRPASLIMSGVLDPTRQNNNRQQQGHQGKLAQDNLHQPGPIFGHVLTVWP